MATDHPARLGRRRFLTISAACGLALAAPGATAAGMPGTQVWQGAALGAEASLRLVHADHGEARRLIRLCLAEIARLERIFSLHRADSALVRLNRDGRLEAPPADLVRLVAEAVRYGHLTGGAFDITVQPLWQLYAGHFAQPGADPAGPPATAVRAAARLVGFGAVRVGGDRIELGRRGMALTLNGIAQGYVTDRITDLLRREGMGDVLVQMGEIRASGLRADGRPWQVSLRDPAGGTAALVGVTDGALATSGGYGTSFDVAGRFGHLLDPSAARPARLWASVTVLAPTATAADALSTAFSALDAQKVGAVLAATSRISARLTALDGTIHTFGSGLPA